MSEFLKPTTPEAMIRTGVHTLNSPLHPILDAFLKSKEGVMEVDTVKLMAKFPNHYRKPTHLQASFVSIVKSRQLPIIIKSANYGQKVFLIRKRVEKGP